MLVVERSSIINANYRVLFTLLFIASYSFALPAHAQFSFTFDTHDSGSYSLDCGAGTTNTGCSGPTGPSPVHNSTIDNTRFSQGSVSIDGENYVHQVISDPASGFNFEIFLLESKAGPGCASLACSTVGEATQNPTGVAMKQVISETSDTDSFYDEFLKEELAKRAKFRQDIASGSMSSTFEIDASALDLTSIPDAPPPMINTVSIDDSSIPVSSIGPSTDFDMSTDSIESKVTGSNFYYIEDTLDPSNPGTYEYINFD